MALHTMRIGSGVPRVAYLHGLLGQGKNLATIAKAVSATDPGVLIDLPNHGRSPWTSTFGYADWADDVAAELRALLPPGVPITVFGHSMGGKTAMALALRHPTLVRALVVADIAPDDSSHGYGFARLVNGLRTLPSMIKEYQFHKGGCLLFRIFTAEHSGIISAAAAGFSI